MSLSNCAFDDIPVATAQFAVSQKNGDFAFTACNRAFSALFGLDATGFDFRELPERLTSLFCRVADEARRGTLHFAYLDSGGGEFLVRLCSCGGGFTACFLPDEDRADVDGQLRLAIHSISTGVIAAGPDGAVDFLNPAARSLTGWGDNALGSPVSRVLNLRYENSLRPVDIFSPEECRRVNVTYGDNVVLKSRDGRSINITLNVTPVEAPDGRKGCVAFFSDASVQRRREKEVVYLSYHDKLTGLFNRAYIEKKQKELDCEPNYPISVIMGDVNGLKMTNDIFGHRQGDMLLVTIANILSLASRDSDVVARYGGDEFVLLMPRTTLEEAAKVCKSILSLCGSKTIDQNKVSVSLGYACKANGTESMNDILNVAENFMYRHKLLESRSYRSSVISSLKKMLFEKSFETEEHAMRITGLCAEAGRLMGLSQSDLNDLELFSMLHDIGKIGIKDRVLLKPGKLTEDEWTEMRKHCEIGYRIAQSAPELSHVADYILCHHERYDGTGYPQGLKGGQIPLLSRILAVADSYDAMVNDRYYRKAMSHEEAVAELKRCSGTQFDPEIVKVFLQILEHPEEELSEPSA